MLDSEPEVLNPFERYNFSKDCCFLCGTKLNEENRTEEHVYPKWLQRRFNLFDKTLVLLNETSIQYKDLKIQCCKRCNNILGERIEKPIERAVNGGYDDFKDIDRTILFQWLNKISYGTLYKEMSLKFDRKSKDGETILTSEELRELRMRYIFLKGTISDAKYISRPYSILIFKLRDSVTGYEYLAHDGYLIPCFFIRMGDIGAVSNLQDNGCNENLYRMDTNYMGLFDKSLYHLQFLEICARFAYKSYLFARTPAYTIECSLDGFPRMIVSHEISGHIFKEWREEEFNQHFVSLLLRWGTVIECPEENKGDLLTCIWNEDGSYRESEKNDNEKEPS